MELNFVSYTKFFFIGKVYRKTSPIRRNHHNILYTFIPLSLAKITLDDGTWNMRIDIDQTDAFVVPASRTSL